MVQAALSQKTGWMLAKVFPQKSLNVSCLSSNNATQGHKLASNGAMGRKGDVLLHRMMQKCFPSSKCTLDVVEE